MTSDDPDGRLIAFGTAQMMIYSHPVEMRKLVKKNAVGIFFGALTDSSLDILQSSLYSLLHVVTYDDSALNEVVAKEIVATLMSQVLPRLCNEKSCPNQGLLLAASFDILNQIAEKSQKGMEQLTNFELHTMFQNPGMFTQQVWGIVGTSVCKSLPIGEGIFLI